MTSRTVYGRALDAIVAEGPISRDELLLRVMAAVPTGMAIQRAHDLRERNRRRSGFALDIPADGISPRYVKQAKSAVFVGAREYARQAISNRLREGLLFINADGLLQHRDWKPE